MSNNKLIFFAAFACFIGLTVFSLLKEVSRDTAQLKYSISGVILSGPGARGIVKTDNAYVLLFDPESFELVASKIVNPFLPPSTFSIGQTDANLTLSGSYRLLVLTDKNGNPNLPTVGEVIGPLSQPIFLGTEGVKYHVDRPFHRLPAELLSSKTYSPGKNIRGTITVVPELESKLSSDDKLVIMLFDSLQGRPVAIKILPSFRPPQEFSIGQADAMAGQQLSGKFSLRILTDNNNQPFHSNLGEIIGRSKSLIPLGTVDLQFELDQEYLR